MSKICQIILSADVFTTKQNLGKHSTVPCNRTFSKSSFLYTYFRLLNCRFLVQKQGLAQKSRSHVKYHSRPSFTHLWNSTYFFLYKKRRWWRDKVKQSHGGHICNVCYSQILPRQKGDLTLNLYKSNPFFLESVFSFRHQQNWPFFLTWCL